MNRRLLGSLALASFVAAAATPAAADMFARISGRVTVGDTTTGIPTVLTISDGSGRTFDVLTDREGRFSAIGLQPGDVSVLLTAQGVKQVSFTCNVPAGETGRFEIGAFSTQEPRLLSGVRTYKIKSEKDGCNIEPSTVDQYVLQ
jgi:hypothetical protein